MKMKAKFLRTGCDGDFVYLVYEYRGHEYTVEENCDDGTMLLAWQHQQEQDEIDRLIDLLENKRKNLYKSENSAQHALDLFFRFINGDLTIEEMVQFLKENKQIQRSQAWR